MTLTARATVDLTATLTSALDLTTVRSPVAISHQYDFADGSSANQANKIFTDQRTLAASASEDLDLAGSLTDALGATLTFTKVRGLMVRAASANTNNVLVGGAASNGFINWVSDATDKVVVRPGGLLLLLAPDTTAYAVTASTGDLLTIANSSSGTSVTYDIVILGS